MADEFDTVTIPELDNLTIALTSYFATSNLNGKLGKATVQELVTFIAPYVQGVASSGFVATTGTVLPTATAGKFTFVGAGTFTQTTGGSITTTQLLNILGANGTSWALILAIPIVIPTAKIPLWTATTFITDSVVGYLGKYWRSNAATLSTDIPGTSTKWVEDLTGYNYAKPSLGDLLTTQDVTGTITQSSYYSSSNVITSSGLAKRTNKIPVSPSDDLWIQVSGNAAYTRIIFYDASDAPTYVGGTNNVLTKINVPATAVNVAVSGDINATLLVQKRFYSYSQLKAAVDAIPTIDKNTVAIKAIQDLGVINITLDFSVAGYYNINTGVFVSSGGFATTGLLNVDKANIYYTGAFPSGAGSGIVFFDTNMVYLGFVSSTTSYTDRLVTKPTGTKFAAISKPTSATTLTARLQGGYVDIQSQTLAAQTLATQGVATANSNKFYSAGFNFLYRKNTVTKANYGNIWAGQSNAEGQTPYSDIATLGLPTTLTKTFKWNNTAFVPYSLPVDQKWGVWWSVLYRLDTYLTNPIYYYNAGASGSNLYANWNPDTNSMTALANNFATRVNDIKTSKTDLNVKCIVWIQGESDNLAPYNDLYYQNLKNQISFQRGVVGNPLLPFIVVGMHPGQSAYDAKVRASQLRVCSEDNHALFVNPDDLTFTSIGDNLHYSGAYCELLGQRIFDLIKDF